MFLLDSFSFQFDEVADKDDLIAVEDTAKRDILANIYSHLIKIR